MTGEGYRCVCHTCGEDERLGTLETAQEFFNVHADLGCEVVLRRVVSSTDPAADDAVRSGGTATDESAGEE